MTPRPRRATVGHGQGLVEFALVLPIFLLVLFGLIDVGRLVYMNSVLSQAAREGARVASVEADWIGSTDPSCGTLGGPVCPANFAALQADVTAAANRMVAPFGSIASNSSTSAATRRARATDGSMDVHVANTTPAPSNYNDLVSVRVILTFQPDHPDRQFDPRHDHHLRLRHDGHQLGGP